MPKVVLARIVYRGPKSGNSGCYARLPSLQTLYLPSYSSKLDLDHYDHGSPDCEVGGIQHRSSAWISTRMTVCSTDSDYSITQLKSLSSSSKALAARLGM